MAKSKRSEEVLMDDPPSADEEVARLRLTLRHKSLLELNEEELVQWDMKGHIVRKGPEFETGVEITESTNQGN